MRYRSLMRMIASELEELVGLADPAWPDDFIPGQGGHDETTSGAAANSNVPQVPQEGISLEEYCLGAVLPLVLAYFTHWWRTVFGDTLSVMEQMARLDIARVTVGRIITSLTALQNRKSLNQFKNCSLLVQQCLDALEVPANELGLIRDKPISTSKSLGSSMKLQLSYHARPQQLIRFEEQESRNIAEGELLKASPLVSPRCPLVLLAWRQLVRQLAAHMEVDIQSLAGLGLRKLALMLAGEDTGGSADLNYGDVLFSLCSLLEQASTQEGLNPVHVPEDLMTRLVKSLRGACYIRAACESESLPSVGSPFVQTVWTHVENGRSGLEMPCLKEMQNYMSQRGVVKTAITLVYNSAHTVRAEAMQLLWLLLEGGNSAVQSSIHELLSQDQSGKHPFFRTVAETIEGGIELVRSLPIGEQTKSPNAIDKEAGRVSQAGPLSKPLSLKRRSSLFTQGLVDLAAPGQPPSGAHHGDRLLSEVTDKSSSTSAIGNNSTDTNFEFQINCLKMLQLMCINHFAPLQHLLRTQRGNQCNLYAVVISLLEPMVDTVCISLESNCGSMTGMLLCAVQAFQVLSEGMQGPCQEVQQDLATGNLLQYCEKLLGGMVYPPLHDIEQTANSPTSIWDIIGDEEVVLRSTLKAESCTLQDAMIPMFYESTTVHPALQKELVEVHILLATLMALDIESTYGLGDELEAGTSPSALRYHKRRIRHVEALHNGKVYTYLKELYAVERSNPQEKVENIMVIIDRLLFMMNSESKLIKRIKYFRFARKNYTWSMGNSLRMSVIICLILTFNYGKDHETWEETGASKVPSSSALSLMEVVLAVIPVLKEVFASRRFWWFVFLGSSSLIGTLFSNFFFAAHLLDYMVNNPDGRMTMQAVLMGGNLLVKTALVTVIIIFMYAIVSFKNFSDRIVDTYECESFFQCLVYHLIFGMDGDLRWMCCPVALLLHTGSGLETMKATSIPLALAGPHTPYPHEPHDYSRCGHGY
eukprot:gene8521-10119_t